jgi:hypothetical protein
MGSSLTGGFEGGSEGDADKREAATDLREPRERLREAGWGWGRGDGFIC